MMYDNAAKCSVVEQTVKQKNGLLPMKRQKGGIQIIIKVTITLASGKKQVISVTVQKTTVRTTKITGLKSSVTVARNKKPTLKPVISPITFQEKVTYSSSIRRSWR